MAGWISLTGQNLCAHYPFLLCRGQFILDALTLQEETKRLWRHEWRAERQKLRQRRQGTSGHDLGRERRHGLGSPGMYRHGRVGETSGFPQKRGLALIRLDQMHLGNAENAEDQARQSRSASEIDQN